jgi:hypothetical protein
MSTQIAFTPEELVLQQLLEYEEEPLRSLPSGEELKGRLRDEIRLALSQIESPQIQSMVETCFELIVVVFGRLALIESNLRRLDTLLESLSIFDVLQYEIRNFVQFLETEALTNAGLDARLAETLDGICYGISHDIKRIFERELSGDIRNQTTPIVYGKIVHSHGLLTNCFQQSLITLLQLFNHSVDPLRIFNDFEERVRQSLILCNDLAALLRVVRTAEHQATPESLNQLVQSALNFRDNSMHYLMYRDWRGYERLALALIAAIEANSDAKDLLHQFNCFLELLYGHVKMRAVLKDMFPRGGEGAEEE